MALKTGLAVVGAGLIGKAHIERVARSGCLAAIVDPDPKSQSLAEGHGVTWAPTLEIYLKDNRPDGVILATPNQLHAIQGLACVAAGVPMLIEKPIAEASGPAFDLVAAAEAAKVPILVGHHRRHNPLIDAARSAIAKGRLGQVTVVNAQFWLYKPDDYFDLTWRREKGGGPVFINLIHDVDLLRHLCGEVVRVQATEANARRGFPVEDTMAILLEFENGALGTVSVSDTVAAPWSWEFTAGENPRYPHISGTAYAIGGTRASLSIPDLKLWSHRGTPSWWSPMDGEHLKYRPEDPLDRQLAHFLDMIETGAEPLVSGREGLKTLLLVEAIKRAAETGQAQTLA